MQQLQLFKIENEKIIKNGNLVFKIQKVEENIFIGELMVPSGKFITKYTLSENKKISSFEILDYAGYLYLTITIIKNIKKLIEAIIQSNN